MNVAYKLITEDEEERRWTREQLQKGGSNIKPLELLRPRENLSGRPVNFTSKPRNFTSCGGTMLMIDVSALDSRPRSILSRVTCREHAHVARSDLRAVLHGGGGGAARRDEAGAGHHAGRS